MLLRLPIALAQVKWSNTLDNLLNEVRKIVYSWSWTKSIARKNIQQSYQINKDITKQVLNS